MGSNPEGWVQWERPHSSQAAAEEFARDVVAGVSAGVKAKGLDDDD